MLYWNNGLAYHLNNKDNDEEKYAQDNEVGYSREVFEIHIVPKYYNEHAAEDVKGCIDISIGCRIMKV